MISYDNTFEQKIFYIEDMIDLSSDEVDKIIQTINSNNMYILESRYDDIVSLGIIDNDYENDDYGEVYPVFFINKLRLNEWINEQRN